MASSISESTTHDAIRPPAGNLTSDRHCRMAFPTPCSHPAPCGTPCELTLGPERHAVLELGSLARVAVLAVPGSRGPFREQAEELFAQLLCLAYSGELAAALAYRGHSRSVRSVEEQARIQQIENEEWQHRSLLREMLKQVGSAPNRFREFRAWCIGHLLSMFCHCCGGFLPMYAAGKLESRNIREYEIAARLAFLAGYSEFVECLLTMAEVEWAHEDYFRSRVIRHCFVRFLPLWQRPLPKEHIRSSFMQEYFV